MIKKILIITTLIAILSVILLTRASADITYNFEQAGQENDWDVPYGNATRTTTPAFVINGSASYLCYGGGDATSLTMNYTNDISLNYSWYGPSYRIISFYDTAIGYANSIEVKMSGVALTIYTNLNEFSPIYTSTIGTSGVFKLRVVCNPLESTVDFYINGTLVITSAPLTCTNGFNYIYFSRTSGAPANYYFVIDDVEINQGVNITTITEEETSATINGGLYTNGSRICGLYYNTTYPIGTSYNVTIGNYSSTGFSYLLSGLTSGDYYYYQPWWYNGTTFEVESTYGTFLTKPNKPTSLTITNTSAANFTLTWTNATVGAGTNQTTVVRYSTDSYPTSATSGTLAYNGTAQTCSLSLTPGVTYYFSAWTYINGSGSPYYWWMSDIYDTTAGSVAGGLFNITFRWECNQSLVDASTADFQSSILCAERIDGTLLSYNNSLLTNPTVINLTVNPNIFRFDYSGNNMTRSMIYRDGQYNYTIYVCCYDNWDYVDANLTDYQFQYTFDFTDYINIFAISQYSELDIYKYNASSKYYVLQDYWDAQDKVVTYLHYGERYFLGVRNEEYIIDFLQYVDTTSDTSFDIIINSALNNTYIIEHFVSVNISARTSTFMWINYTDISFDTISANLSIYVVYSNGSNSLIHQYNYTSPDEDYQWTMANGYNTSNTYLLVFNINNSNFALNQSYSLMSFPFSITSINVDWFDTFFDTYIMDITSVFGISVSQIALFVFSFICLIGIGNKYQSLGLVMSGAILCIGLTLLFNNGPLISAGGIVIGVLLIIIGLVTMRGDLK
jgi:hypothetical protein